ncbi:putative oxidoreductase C-terminal domain-containing protein [Catalinimonas niigatensis]|uniref:putative oxidoreductase C-terminal domain-containing protein n=1 Tax=Catalinimonas niigatensis TaxID=1397264 RepID=UPI002665F902|nr:putative oxidoreductase C-terminal domain-containing protein [Catalinimonas niigatensis]WPP50047.1 putative oxidoreductase C-terminal domain-containing protein [Catalinimonas niigatensis]
MNLKPLFAILILIVAGCANSQENENPSDETTQMNNFTGASGEVKLMTLDPGHFHAALVQKFMYDQVDSVVHVYAPEGEDLQMHLNRIESFNNREDNPTHWVQEVYTGPDFFEKMMEEQPGNVVVLSGNNAKKTEYIKTSVEAGLNVLADKPMVIKPSDYPALKSALATAQEKGVLLYDIMTERYEISTMLQKALSQQASVFGELEKGTPDDPAISKISVHHFFKYVSGSPLIRPAWFFDTEQQGEGIVDVSTHLVDLILWECFPEEVIDTANTEVVSARRWPTKLTPSQFNKVTNLEEYPDYLQKDIEDDSVLNTYSNGEFVFTVRGVHGKVSVIWNFEAPEGAMDTHYSMMRGSLANLVIRQDEPQNYKPALYVEPTAAVTDQGDFEQKLKAALDELNEEYPGLSMKKADKGWEVEIPEEYKVGHEAHFSQVTEKYLQYLKEGELPEWEMANMIAKYYITMQAYEKSRTEVQ